VKTENSSADELLRRATQMRDAGDINAAIELMRRAYSKIASSHVSYPVSTFLRLPLYLQDSGRSDEAWKEFKSLLNHGFPNQLSTPQFLPMDHSQIYDKMRLFLQREREFERAVSFGILSYMSWAVGLYRQKRRSELKGYIKRENIDVNLAPLLKKARRLEVKDELVDVIAAEINRLPEIDLESLKERIDSILSRSSI
jgi:hypothetical protein